MYFFIYYDCINKHGRIMYEKVIILRLAAIAPETIIIIPYKKNQLLPIPSVSKKSWHFWIVCQIKTVKHFRIIFICMDG